MQKNSCKTPFSEWCEEVPDLPLEDGTKKIFLNMSSKNGHPELISLLQYMKNTSLDNPDIIVKDKRIIDLDRIVGEVKQSEEWEAVSMSILDIGLAKGEERGIEKGKKLGIKALIETSRELGASKEDTLVRLKEKCGLSENEAKDYLGKYWV